MTNKTTSSFADRLFSGDGDAISRDVSLSVAEGRITEISDSSTHPGRPRRFVIPALVNAHDHARASISSFGAAGLPLETWLPRTVNRGPPEPYLAAASALARAAKAGCGAMMVHYTRLSGTMSAVDEARAIARAADDVGIRIAFALAVRDQNPLVYGDGASILQALSPPGRATIENLFMRPGMTPTNYLALVDEIADAIAGPLVDVQYGPAGVQWCSKPMLEAIADASARTGRRVHMHLLETKYQRAWADEAFPNGIVAFLRDIGLLSERLTVAHCVYATPAELELIAASGTRLVTNFSSNLHLHSGIAPIATAKRCGCAVAIGVDGTALDQDDDALREMRLVHLANVGTGFDRNWSQADFFSGAIRAGRAAVGAPGDGALRPGAPADFTVLDFDQLDRDAIMDVNALDLLFSRGNASAVRDVVVAGRTIVADGKVLGVDLPAIEQELRAMYRANLKDYAAFDQVWPTYEAEVRRWFASHFSCS